MVNLSKRRRKQTSKRRGAPLLFSDNISTYDVAVAVGRGMSGGAFDGMGGVTPVFDTFFTTVEMFEPHIS